MPSLLFALLAFLAVPDAEIQTVAGDRLAGQLVELNAESLVYSAGGETRSLAAPQILEIRQSVAAVPLPPGPRVDLQDGSRISCREVAVSRDRARLTLHSGTEVGIPTNRIAALRLGESTPALDDGWNSLRERESKNDLLVIRKEDQLDFLPGVAGELGEKISFLVDGEELPVPRSKVYGIIYRRRNAAAARVACVTTLANGDVLQAQSASVAEGKVRLRLGGNVDLEIPLVEVAGLDFSAGKVRYLSQLEPREKKLVPLFDLPRDVERDRSLLGTPLTLAGKTYARGLGIFPQTRLRYRIAGEYSRFRALAGIDDAAPRLKTSVHLTITGDGRMLFDAEISPADAPRGVDCDVTGIRDLEIFVDFGADQLNIGDFLDLADAKLTK